MEMFTEYLWAFLIGGALCLIGQLLIDLTKLTPARILTAYVVAGVVLGALGLYKPLVDLAGGGATVPLTGFGYHGRFYFRSSGDIGGDIFRSAGGAGV